MIGNYRMVITEFGMSSKSFCNIKATMSLSSSDTSYVISGKMKFFTSSLFLKGVSNVINCKRVIPRAWTSNLNLSSSLTDSSSIYFRHAYGIVLDPLTVTSLIVTVFLSKFLDIPKSAILIISLSFTLSTNMLGGLISLWTIKNMWQYATPERH
jgi:hypothetical protein